jgi:hypothetical protein
MIDMNTYNYKDLISSYRYYVMFKGDDSFKYFTREYKAMSIAFGISFENEQKDNQLEYLRLFFEESIKESNQNVNPFIYNSKPPKIIKDLQKTHLKKFEKIEESLNKAYWDLQCDIFEKIYGRIDKVITSEDLLRYGCNDKDCPYNSNEKVLNKNT